MFRSLLRVGLGILLLLPILIIIEKTTSWEWPPFKELLLAIQFTLLQSLISTLATVGVGIFVGIGLLGVQSPANRRTFEVICLLPGFLPPLMVILPWLQGVMFFKYHPFGLLGIVVVHAFMNVGVTGVLLAHLLEYKVGSYVELAWVEGASRWTLLMRGLVPLLKSDLWALSFYLFSLFFVSFSVPLILAGPTGVTLEVLIYEKIRVYGDWGQALSLGVIQMGMLFLFSVGIKSSFPGESKRKPQMRYLAQRSFLLIPLLISFWVTVGQFQSVYSGWQEFLLSPLLVEDWVKLIVGTLVVSLGTGLGVFMLLSLIAALSPHRGLDRLLTGYVSPSTTITGFAFLLLGISGWREVHGAIVLGLVIIMIPSLYRMLGRALIQSLRDQILIAQISGADGWMIFHRVVFPQVKRSLGWLSGLSAFWASADFGLSSLLAENNSTLALLVKAYMTSYRLELASVFNLILIGIGWVCFFVFAGVKNVRCAKSFS